MAGICPHPDKSSKQKEAMVFGTQKKEGGVVGSVEVYIKYNNGENSFLQNNEK